MAESATRLEYEKLTTRPIPVVILERVAA